jgi:CheY-like chemotaxis protein
VTSSIPIIACSAYASQEKMEEALRAGMVDYLQKPIPAALMKAKIESSCPKEKNKGARSFSRSGIGRTMFQLRQIIDVGNYFVRLKLAFLRRRSQRDTLLILADSLKQLPNPAAQFSYQS